VEVQVEPESGIAADEQELGPRRGVEVRVSSVAERIEHLDADQITVKAPFPVKPLSAPPPGWKLEPSDDPQRAVEEEVDLGHGARLKLTIRPHILVPDANGATTFEVVEPGFDQALQYRQTETVGSLLGASIRRLRTDEERMGEAIRRLEQLLVSLPDPEP
jgi:hypothetical protein